jgi:probable F420-dependent oxidoreductase
VRDHLSADALGPQWAPFSALATAAAITTRLHVGTMVLANDFRHPAVVAHEAATLAALSDGRFELGLGAGWFQPEYRAAGIVFDEPSARIARLQESIEIIQGLLRGDAVDVDGLFYAVKGLELPVVPERPPPLLVGGGGRRMLAFAGRVADIVGILPAPIRTPDDPDSASDRSPESFARKVDLVRTAAGAGRFEQIELCAFVTIRITSDKRGETERLIAERGWNDAIPEDVWAMPTVFVGTRDEVRDLLVERRERFGLAYVVMSDEDIDVAAQLVDEG